MNKLSLFKTVSEVTPFSFNHCLNKLGLKPSKPKLQKCIRLAVVFNRPEQLKALTPYMAMYPTVSMTKEVLEGLALRADYFDHMKSLLQVNKDYLSTLQRDCDPLYSHVAHNIQYLQAKIKAFKPLLKKEFIPLC